MRRSPLQLWYVRGKHHKSKNAKHKTAIGSSNLGSLNTALTSYHDQSKVMLPNISHEMGRWGVPWDKTEQIKAYRTPDESTGEFYARVMMQSVELRSFGPKMERYGDGSVPQKSAKSFVGNARHFDRRLVPIGHEALRENCLKGIRVLFGPDGRTYSPGHLEGVLVGILIFSESDTSLQFMNSLSMWLKEYKKQRLRNYIIQTGSRPQNDRMIEDFAVIAISNAGTGEWDKKTKGLGFYHCTHNNGANLVLRDVGYSIYPQPKLMIVNGNTGRVITPYGYTALRRHPDTCMEDWKQGKPGMRIWDMFLPRRFNF
eukprot:PhF_6_TR31776/c0_g1_i1/m.46792